MNQQAIQEVTLAQVLENRDRRVRRQLDLHRKWGTPLISFSMNIPGPVKDSPLIRRGFWAGCRALEDRLPGEWILEKEITLGSAGCEALYAVSSEAEAIKSITVSIEDSHSLGRLFDMDVLDAGLHKLDREALGGGSRDCIVCGAPGRGCASRRLHSVPALQQAVSRLLTGCFAREDALAIGALAADSLGKEVETTPKPGLVDRNNTGSHEDMTLLTFHRSARALEPYFCRCAQIGMETAALSPEQTFSLLRQAGLEAEQTMLAATGGVNTHKGAIFTMGLLCGAAGRLWKPQEGWDIAAIFPEVSAMTRQAMEADLSGTIDTPGGNIFRRCGIRGIRGEAAQGFPSLARIGLPVYRQSRDGGLSQNDAGVIALLHLITRVEDTCMIHRGGLDLAREAAQKTAALLHSHPQPDLQELEALDRWFIRRRLSPGGCADLLSAVYFLDALERWEGQEK